MVFVERERYRGTRSSGGDWRDWVQPTFTLDRQVFEETGKADRSKRGSWDWTYYSSPDVYYAELGQSLLPPCLRILGLPQSCTQEDVKRAYRRLAKSVHPDGGGSAEDLEVRLNHTHPVAERMSPRDRESVLRAGNCAVEMLDVSWKDTVPESLRRQWRSPHESLADAVAWHHIRMNSLEALGVDVGDILQADGLPCTALRCLDEDDWNSLSGAVVDGALAAYRGNRDVSATARERLIDWLQDWTETDEGDLGLLVELAQDVAGSDRPEGFVNWIKEGF